MISWAIAAAIAVSLAIGIDRLRWRLQAPWAAARALEEAAREVGLAYTPGRPGTVQGTLDEIEITIRPGQQPGGDSFRFRVPGLPPISFRREGMPVSRDDIRTGDAAFDRELRIDGENATVLAVLDAHTREVVTRHVKHYGGSLDVADGVLTLECRNLPTTAAPIVTDLYAMRDLALALATRYRRKGRVGCLAENAVSDPERDVRIRNLEVLLGLERNEFSLAAFDAAASHPDPELRLLGAIGAGREEDVKAIALTSAMAPAVRGRALRRLVETLAREDAETLLLGVSRESIYPELMQVVLESLARVGSTRSVERLLELAGPLTTTGRLASSAIEQIQGRHAGAAPGQLSVASGDGGAVSLATTPGALSHAKKSDA